MNLSGGLLSSILVSAAIGILGCRTNAEVYVWHPPLLDNTSARKIVLASVVGPPTLADSLSAEMLTRIPKETSKNLSLVTQEQLQENSGIQLASAFESLPSDIALQAEARRRGYEYLLFGEILVYSSVQSSNNRDSNEVDQANDISSDSRVLLKSSTDDLASSIKAPWLKRGDRVAVSWRLLDIVNQIDRGGAPVSVEVDEEITDPQLFVARVAEESWQLLLPHVKQVSTTLVRPRLMVGSTEVRRGVALAESGKWSDAAEVWKEVLAKYPRNHAALHNLAMAMVAKQEFSQAKQLAQQALRLYPSSTYEHSVVWIEQQQMLYTKAFQLDKPVEGWLFAPDE